MTTSEGRTKIPPAAGEEGPSLEPVEDREDGPTYYAGMDWDYGAHYPPELAGRRRAFFGRRDELEVIARMLVRHHGFDHGRARALAFSRPEELFRQRGRPAKPHLIHAADVADEILWKGESVRWDVVHRQFVAWNHPGESRMSKHRGELIRDPRDSENWQRAVRRIINRLRAEAARLAEAAK